jgi:sugar-specific transcriptional regulator TrmB
MEMENSLRRIGLTEGEIRVYVALLGEGETTTGRIVRAAGVSSSKVYPILDRLVAMGLVSYIRKGRVRHFKATSPAKILDMLEKRKVKIEEQKAEIEKLLPALLAREKSKKPGHEASVYEGYKAVKSYYRDLLRGSVKGEERLVFGARSGYPVARGAQYFFQSFHRAWVKRGLKTRMIFNEDLRGRKSVEFYNRFPRTDVRFLTHVTLSSIGIHKDCIDLLVWTRESALLFVIRSREVARTFRNYFEVLWRSAKK